jgi:hypothetical protein
MQGPLFINPVAPGPGPPIFYCIHTPLHLHRNAYYYKAGPFGRSNPKFPAPALSLDSSSTLVAVHDARLTLHADWG